MSLRTRLLAAFAYVILVVTVALTVPLALNLARRVDAEIKSEAATQAQLIAASASGRLDERAQLDELTRRAARGVGGRVVVVDANGRLVSDSAGSGLRGTSYASRPELAQALRGQTSQGTRHSDSLGEDLLYTAVPVIDDGVPEGAVRVTQSVEEVQSEIRNDVIALVGVGVLGLLLGLGVGWLLAGSLARPQLALAATARRVSAGDLDQRAAATGSSEQREVAAAFNEMTERLAHTLRAQREFVANASHQLRTPLTGLRLRIEAAKDKTTDPGVERDLAAAEQETERLTRLLRELLTLAREQPTDAAEPVSLATVATAAADRWRAPAREQDQTLALEDGGAVEVSAAAADLAIVLDNLLENAITYSPAGTTLTLAWGTDGEHGYLAVSDEGPGLTPDEQREVFERFYRGQAGRDQPGTGLGLPIVAELARRWGGTASLENRPQGGARALVRLPRAGSESLRPARRTPDA